MSGTRYEPLSQAEDTTIIPKNSRSLPSYDPQVPQASRHVLERSSSSDEDEEERMKLQEGDVFNEDLEEDVVHKESVGCSTVGKSCANESSCSAQISENTFCGVYVLSLYVQPLLVLLRPVHITGKSFESKAENIYHWRQCLMVLSTLDTRKCIGFQKVNRFASILFDGD